MSCSCAARYSIEQPYIRYAERTMWRGQIAQVN
jgi:hypothetical protein